MASTDGLIEALGTTFFVILLGYVLRRLKIITADHASGIGRLIGRVSLPCLLFLAMATIDFGQVEWLLLLGIGLSKVGIFALVYTLSVLLGHNNAPIAASALRGIFVTQSNDFALGLPVMRALYPADIYQYIFLLAPVQLVIINPVGFILMEKGVAKAGLRGNKGASLSSVVLKVLKNPIVFMTLLGLIGNFAMDSDPPDVIEMTLRLLGNAFSAGALLNLGGSMVNRLGSLKGKGLLVPLLLIGAKSLLLPILCKVVLSAMGVGDVVSKDDHKVYDLALFGFIYGTFPSAPTVYIYATEYGILITEMTQAIVLGTIVAAPMMFVTAQMADLTTNEADYRGVLTETYESVGYISLIAVVWVICVYAYSGHLKRRHTRLNIIVLAIIMFVFHLTTEFCQLSASETNSQVRFAIIHAALYSIRISVVLNTLYMMLYQMKGPEGAARWEKFLQAFSLLSVALYLGLLVGFLDVPPGGLNSPVCWYAVDGIGNDNKAAQIVEAIQLSLCIAALMIALSKLLKFTNPSPSTQDLSDPLVASGTPSAHPSTPYIDMQQNTAEPDTNNAVAISTTTSSIADIEEDEYLVDDYDERFVRDKTQLVAEETEEAEEEKETEEPVSFRDILFIVFQLCSMTISLSLRLWTLTSSDREGVYIQMAFLDVVLIAMQGFMLGLIYGTKSRVIKPIGKLLHRARAWIRKQLYSTEVVTVPNISDDQLDDDVKKTRDRLLPHLSKFKKSNVRKLRYRLRTFTDCFTGKDLVDWLIHNGHAESRIEAEGMGKELVNARILHHVYDEHHFEDEKYFYRFYLEALPEESQA